MDKFKVGKGKARKFEPLKVFLPPDACCPAMAPPGLGRQGMDYQPRIRMLNSGSWALRSSNPSQANVQMPCSSLLICGASPFQGLTGIRDRKSAGSGGLLNGNPEPKALGCPLYLSFMLSRTRHEVGINIRMEDGVSSNFHGERAGLTVPIQQKGSALHCQHHKLESTLFHWNGGWGGHGGIAL